MLGRFNEQDYTVRICRAIFSTVPSAPPFVYYKDLNGAVKRIRPDAGSDVVQRATELSKKAEVGRALWVADALDAADVGLAAFAGLKNLFSLFASGPPRRRTFEADRPQAVDAALKLMGLSYMTYKLFGGSTAERISQLTNLPAGREAIVYYAVAEIALPFTDNVLEVGGSVISKLMQHASGEGASRFGQFAGQESVREATGVLEQLTKPLEAVMIQVKEHLDPLIEKLKLVVPGVLGVADSVTGAVATGLDAIPVWRFVGGRLAAESCALRAGLVA